MNDNVTDGKFSIADNQHAFRQLPALAKRLGVEPQNGNERHASVYLAHENMSYDLFKLINAFLDRIEERLPR